MYLRYIINIKYCCGKFIGVVLLFKFYLYVTLPYGLGGRIMNISLYKIRKNVNLNDIFKYLREESYEKKDHMFQKGIGIYLFIEIRDRSPKDWQVFLSENFDFDEFEDGNYINSIIIFKIFSSLYVVPFGRAYHAIIDIIDFEFGMNFAEKQIVNKKIKGKKINYYLQNKIRELTTFNKNWIEAPIPNQSYSEISGGVRKPNIFGNNVTCSDKVKFTLNLPPNKTLLDKIIDIIIETDKTLNTPIKKSNIPRIKPITKDNLSYELYKELSHLIKCNNTRDLNLNFVGIYEANGVNELLNFNQIKFYYKKRKVENIIKINEFEEFLPMLQRFDYNLDDIKIDIVSEIDEVKRWDIWKILDISIKYNNNMYIHENNKWYFLNNSFVSLLESQLKEIPIKQSSLLVNDVNNVCEDKFIENVTKENENIYQLHKKFIKGNISTKIELADLYDIEEDELYAVKMGLKTNDSIYSLQQSILSLSMLNDKDNYDFSEITSCLPNDTELERCKKYSILWPLTEKKTPQKYLDLYDNNNLTLDKLGSMLLKLKISEWYALTVDYGYTPKVYFIR
jgi:uncharacterized protein (TIGR04141 family)